MSFELKIEEKADIRNHGRFLVSVIVFSTLASSIAYLKTGFVPIKMLLFLYGISILLALGSYFFNKLFKKSLVYKGQGEISLIVSEREETFKISDHPIEVSKDFKNLFISRGKIDFLNLFPISISTTEEETRELKEYIEKNSYDVKERNHLLIGLYCIALSCLFLSPLIYKVGIAKGIDSELFKRIMIFIGAGAVSILMGKK